ncbi:aspartic proteinase CDR1-like [Pyrus x bretschneideri]|uniref:aspartic proteinase CDR1-like n=1 Tax=Pyrus x bretschneideri TaxID=225117 RepID=UPI00202ECB76|nr:aspartic proteinase CDR1-like [Pyrus x bretschneideri]
MASADTRGLSLLHNYGAVAMILIIYLVICHSSAIEARNFDVNGGFSVKLIRRNSLNSPLNNHNYKISRRLIEESTPQSELKRDKEGGEGAQLMKLSLGTPSYEIYAVADTGSTLLWTQCEPCPTCYKQKNPKFDPKKSSSYATLPCTAHECSYANDTGYTSCSNDDQKVCNYNYTYMDDSITQGVMSKETITFGSSSGKPVSFKDVVFGCGHNNTGETFAENEMGIVGLGAGNLSIISQLAPHVGGKKFSHCLVPFNPDHPNDASIMSFGKGSEVSGEGVVSTPLITKADKNQYFVTVEGFSVGEQFVPFNSSGSVSKGNMYLDSGTQVTMLPQDFYGRLVEQVKKVMNSSLKPVEVHDESGTVLCYNTTENLKAPLLTVHFDGGAKLQLSPAQTFYQNKQYKLHCFGTLNASDTIDEGVGLYGSYAQSNFLIGFDLEKMLVSFKAVDCRKTSSTSPSPSPIPNSAFAIHFSYFFNYVFSFILIVILYL